MRIKDIRDPVHLVVLCGGQAVGKSVVADYLERGQYFRIERREYIEKIIIPDYESACPRHGYSGRELYYRATCWHRERGGIEKLFLGTYLKSQTQRIVINSLRSLVEIRGLDNVQAIFIGLLADYEKRVDRILIGSDPADILPNRKKCKETVMASLELENGLFNPGQMIDYLRALGALVIDTTLLTPRELEVIVSHELEKKEKSK